MSTPHTDTDTETTADSDYTAQAREELAALEEEGDPDAWDARITDTGCYAENIALQLCHADTGDWRQCMREMQAFRECWEQHGNRERVNTVDRK